MDRGEVHQFADIGSLGAFEDAGFEGGDGANGEVQGLGDLVRPPSPQEVVKDVDLTGRHICEWDEGIFFPGCRPEDIVGDIEFVVQESAEHGQRFRFGCLFGDDIADPVAKEGSFIDAGGSAGEDHDLEVGVEAADGGDDFESAAVGEHDIEDEVGDGGGAQFPYELLAGGGFADLVFIDMLFHQEPESLEGQGVVFGDQ